MTSDDLTTAIVLGAASISGLWLWYESMRRARLIEDTPTSKCRSAAQGYVELIGTQHTIPTVPVVAPLTGTPCTWWQYTVEERRITYRDGRMETHWDTIEEAASDSPFLLRDDTGEAIIDPRGAQVTPSTEDVWYGELPRPSGPPGGMGLTENSYRYTEARTHDEQPIYAMGRFRTLTDANVVVARVPGVTPGTHLVSRPLDDRAFIVADMKQPQLTTKHRAIAVSGLITFFVCGGLAVFATATSLLP